MNKPNIIREVSLQSGYAEKEVREILDAAGRVMLNALCNKSEVSILGLGKIKTVERPPKKGRDIGRGVEVMIPARTSVSFSPSRPLSLGVNGGVAEA